MNHLDNMLRSATAAFNRHGFRGTSIHQVAKSMGLSKTSFYRFAATKEDLLDLCAQHSFNLIGQMRQAARIISENPLDALLQDLYFSRQLLKREPGPTLSPYLYNALPEERQRAAKETFKSFRFDLIALLQQCVDDGRTLSFNPYAIQSIITACANIPIRDVDEAQGYLDPVVEFVLYGIESR